MNNVVYHVRVYSHTKEGKVNEEGYLYAKSVRAMLRFIEAKGLAGWRRFEVFTEQSGSSEECPMEESQ